MDPATSLDAKIRNGKKAVECAKEAIERSPRSGPEYWDTLAAAKAEAVTSRRPSPRQKKPCMRPKRRGATISLMASRSGWSYSEKASLITPRPSARREIRDEKCEMKWLSGLIPYLSSFILHPASQTPAEIAVRVD